MKTKFLNLALTVSLAGVFLIACNEELPMMDNQVVQNSEIEQTTFQVNVISSKDYLTSMIESIKIAKDQGLIKPGQANALIAQLNAAILNTNNGNTNAATQQLEAISAEVQGLADAGQIPTTVAKELANTADGAAALTQGYFTDPIDNYKYPVVLIGDQIWMAENLRATNFNDGTPITEMSDYNEWSSQVYMLNGPRTPAYCWYLNDYNTYGDVYGALYNFYAVNTGKICPAGWHVPSSLEVSYLIKVADPSASLGNYGGPVYPNGTLTLGSSPTAGAMLKEAGTLHWSEGNASNNIYGFTALPGGRRFRAYDQGFDLIGNECHFWTTDYLGKTYSIGVIPWSIVELTMYRNSDGIKLDLNQTVATFYDGGFQGNSVRCVKD